LKGRLSPVAYLVAIPTAFLSQRIAGLIYIGVALVWLVPDRRVETGARRGHALVGA
jgi:hypothetical protein